MLLGLAVRALEATCRFRPARDLPPAVQVLGSAILVLQVVRVFPDIADQQYRLARGQHTLVIGQRNDFQRLRFRVRDENRPSGGEVLGRDVSEFRPEGLE